MQDSCDSSSSSSDSDVEDDPTVKHTRTSTEIAEFDRDLLNEEEERENLLTAGAAKEPSRAPWSFLGKRRKEDQPSREVIRRLKGKQRRLRRKRRDKNTSDNDEGHTLFEMEEGGPRSEVSSQASSSSAEQEKTNSKPTLTSKRRKLVIWHVITISIASLFVLLTFGAYKVSQSTNPTPILPLSSNGSSSFKPTTILISLDGFRADFLQRGITPTLNQFIAEGVSPKYMLPSFPSLTFPNHYTLVTGLYPESHGIVGNTFWAPDLEEEFHTDRASLQKKWWAGAEPIWVTAEMQDIKTAIHMWPGSEAGMDFSATYLDKFNMSEVLPRKTDRILELLDLPSQRPQLVAAYVPVVDSDGHKYGPNSSEIWSTISEVDVMLHTLFRGLNERNLTDIVNVVVVSDHGMATTSTDRCIQLDDIIDLNLIEHIDGWPLYGLRPKNPIDLRGLYDRLLVESQSNGNFDVYLRDENMPAKYHFSKSDRIAPLWVVPKVGYAIVHKEDFDVEAAKARGETYHPKGLHGYDHEHPLMRAIFVARGPAFPHKPNSRLETFQNTEVYNIICDSIGIEPKPSNGTLRLPLKPVGLHSDEPESSTDVPEDFPSDKTSPTISMVTGQATDSEAKPVSGEELTVIEDDKSTGRQKETKVEMNKFWTYVKAKMAAAQEWANKVVASLKSNHKDTDKQDASFDQGISQ